MTERRKHSRKRARAAIAGYLILFAFSAFAVYRVEAQGKDTDRAIVSVLIKGCQTSRGGISDLIRDQIRSVQQTNPRDFPDIPRPRFEMLRQTRIADQQKLLIKLSPNGCDDTYGGLMP